MSFSTFVSRLSTEAPSFLFPASPQAPRHMQESKPSISNATLPASSRSTVMRATGFSASTASNDPEPHKSITSSPQDSVSSTNSCAADAKSIVQPTTSTMMSPLDSNDCRYLDEQQKRVLSECLLKHKRAPEQWNISAETQLPNGLLYRGEMILGCKKTAARHSHKLSLVAQCFIAHGRGQLKTEDGSTYLEAVFQHGTCHHGFMQYCPNVQDSGSATPFLWYGELSISLSATKHSLRGLKLFANGCLFAGELANEQWGHCEWLAVGEAKRDANFEQNYVYVGSINQHGQPHGLGSITFNKARPFLSFSSFAFLNAPLASHMMRSYKGQWVNGKKEGFGECEMIDGSSYFTLMSVDRVVSMIAIQKSM